MLPTLGKYSVPHATAEAHGERPGAGGNIESQKGGGVVLSSREERIWDDVLLFWAEEAEEPARAVPGRWNRTAHDEADLPGPVVVGSWITIASILFGAMVFAVVVGVATALGWALWHYWARLTGQHAAGSAPSGPTVPRS